MRLSWATNFFTHDRFRTHFPVLLDDLLNSALRYFDVPRNLFYAYMLAILMKDIKDHRPVQFHILDDVAKPGWGAK